MDATEQNEIREKGAAVLCELSRMIREALTDQDAVLDALKNLDNWPSNSYGVQHIRRLYSKFAKERSWT